MSSINPAATLGPVAEGLAPISFNPVLTAKINNMEDLYGEKDNGIHEIEVSPRNNYGQTHASHLEG